jgi:sigma-54 dependent transcriptional regulator, acetoin dehydrogenase operon transcriptional activator AcoR
MTRAAATSSPGNRASALAPEYHGPVPDATDTFASDTPRSDVGPVDWVLIAALDCERLTAPPSRISLGGITGIDIGRGAARSFEAAGDRLRIELADRWASQHHARVVRDGDGWTVEDAGSKNGTRVNGERVERAALVDGDILEVGGSFLVLRRASASVRPREGAPRSDGLDTMSPALEREIAVLGKIARSRVPVLLRGESGTGKEIMATAIHALSGRRGPLLPVNCGAIPATLLESELFGSRRGAFSGAEDRPGLVRSAENGTLFLDEVVELPATSQAALLRFLQDGEIVPLGADKRITVDVRVIAATNKPVEDLVARGAFRRDLYARLCGYVMRLPPLHARMEDLGLLIASLLARLEPDGPPRRLSRTAARALFRHRWPLNVRELEQALRAAIATATGPEITSDDLRLETGLDAAPSAQHADGRARIVALLDKHEGNLTAVARGLSTSRSQVRRLLARHGLMPRDYKRR